MLCIVAHHIYQRLVLSFSISIDNTLIDYILNSLGYLSSAVFFLLSGYGVRCSLGKNQITSNYICNHIVKLISPYIYAWAVYCILCGSLKLLTGWFYWTILILYVLVYTLHGVVKDELSRNILLLSIVLVYILIASKYLAIFYYDSVLLFPLGYSIASHKSKISFPKIYIIPIFLFLLVFVRFNFSYGGLYYGNAFRVAIAPVASFFALMLVSLFKIKNKLFDYIGKNSLLFYVLQLALIVPLTNIANPIKYCTVLIISLFCLTYIYTFIKEKLSFKYGKN